MTVSFWVEGDDGHVHIIYITAKLKCSERPI